MVERDKVEYRDPTEFDDSKLQDLLTINSSIRHKQKGKDVRAPIAQLSDALIKLFQDASNYDELGALAELVEARGGFETLGLHESAQDSAIDNTPSKNDLGTKADITYVDSILSNLTQENPKAIFYSLSALKEKYPNGATGIFLVFEASNKDGAHNYVWDNTNKYWKDLGVYQAGISVPRMRPGVIVTSLRFNINTSSKQIEFDDGYVGVADIYTQYNLSENYTQKSVPLPNDSGFLWFNTEDNTFVTTGKTGDALNNYIYLGFYFMNSAVFSFLGDYTIDGYKIKTVYDMPLLSYQAQLLSTKKVIVDRINKKLIFPDGGTFNIQVSNGVYKLKIAGTEMDLSSSNGNYLFFDRTKSKIVTQTSYVSTSNEISYLGYINFGTNFAIDLNMNYMVKDYSLQAKYAGQFFAALGDSTVNGDNGQGKTDNSWSWVSYMGYLCGFSDVENDGVNASRVTKGTSRDDSLVERYDQIKNKDFVTVMAGVNDFVNNMPLGKISSIGSQYDVTTFYGAYQTIVEGLKANNPNAKLLLITPMKVNNDRASSFKENSLGLKQIAYINAIKEVAELYGLRVHDLYGYAGFSPFLDSDEIYTHDKQHPTELGYKVLAEQIAGTINKM